jgi:hypothetical protein
LLKTAEDQVALAKEKNEKNALASASKSKPTDLYQNILDNIDKYSYLCESEYAGPITKKQILAHLTGNKWSSKDNSDTASENKTGIKAPLTVALAPKFKTEERMSLKDRSHQASEDLELAKIDKMRAEIDAKRKLNQDRVKSLSKYEKPIFKKTKSTIFSEFKLNSDDRGSKHSEFIKQNMEKLEQEKVLKQQKENTLKQQKELDAKKSFAYYNQKPALEKNEEKSESESQAQAFVSLRSQLETVLVRKNKEQKLHLNSPESRSKNRQLTTPRSPGLSVKKRYEFNEKNLNIKSTEELELDEMSRSGFKARQMPTKTFSAYKPISGNTPSGKKTEFKEFNLSQIKGKKILTTEEIELKDHSKEFKATELNPKLFDRKIEDILGRPSVTIYRTIPVEFNLKTTDRKRDRKATEKSMENSTPNSLQKKKRYVKGNAAPNLSTSKRTRPAYVEEYNTQFKAKPVPNYSKISSESESKTAILKAELTKPVEFKFSTD